MRMIVAGLLLALALCDAGAAELRPFIASSRAAIERAHAGKPFILVFWSVDCAYCAEEIKQLRRLGQDRPAVALVLVSTDPPESSSEVGAMLDHLLGIAPAERWMFATDDVEHLYFAVDRKWHGELPRAYFYDAAGNARTVAGKVETQWLEAWVRMLKLPLH